MPPGSVFQRVGNEIIQDLFNSCVVEFDKVFLPGALCQELHLGRGIAFVFNVTLLDQIREIKPIGLEFDVTGFDFREIQHVIDQV